MTEDAIKARREYQRQWRQQNQERCKAYKDRYWERVAERQKQGELHKDQA